MNGLVIGSVARVQAFDHLISNSFVHVIQQGSGIDTIKYHTCPKIANGKVTKSP